MKKNHITKWMVAGLAASLLTACGGGGGSDSVTGSDSISGVVADGYLVGASVFCDLDGDLTWDAGEPAGTTGPGGNYTLTGMELEQCTIVAEIVAGQTVDEDNPGQPVDKGYLLTAPKGRPEFVSPLTTLIQQRHAKGEDMAAAETALREALGADENDDLFQDYIAAGNGGLHAMARAIAKGMGDFGQTLASDPDQTFTNDAELLEAVAARMQELLGMTSGSSMMAQVVRGNLGPDLAPEEVDAISLDGNADALPVFAQGNFWLTGVADDDHSLLVRLTDGPTLEMPFRMTGGGGLDLGTVSAGAGQMELTGFNGYRFGWEDADGDGLNDNCRDAEGDGICDAGTRFEGYTFRLNDGYVDDNGDGVNDLFVDADGDGLNDLTGLPYGRGFGWVDENGDGIHDLFIDADGDGISDFGPMPFGQPFGYEDADGDGINDRFVDADGDGLNDLTGLPYMAMPGWVDEDNDGINDQFVDVDGDGLNDLTGLPYGHGFGWEDADGDGINDRFVDADGDRINDLDGRSYGYGFMGPVMDTDGDGIDDTSGLPYRQCFGWVDENGDGINDRFADDDGDGVNDMTGRYYDRGFMTGPGGKMI